MKAGMDRAFSAAPSSHGRVVIGGGKPPSWFCFEFQFLLLLLLPGLMNVHLDQDSLRGGLLIGLFSYVACYLARSGHEQQAIDLRYFLLAALFLVFLVVQFAVVGEYFMWGDSVRFFLSLALIFFILMLVPFFCHDLMSIGEIRVFLFCRLVFWILSLSGILASLLYVLGLNDSKGLILFKEPSHFALMYLPFLFYMSCVSRGWLRVFYPLVGFLIAFSVQNLTLVVGLLLVVALIDLKKVAVLGAGAVVAALFVSNTSGYFNYYLDRLDFSGGSQNLSVLVYLSGGERAYLSVVESLGGGIGFQQLGVVGPEGHFMESIVQIVGARLNYNDGGFLAAKVIAELGVFGLFLVLGFLCVLVRLILACKFSKRAGQFSVFPVCVFVMFSIELFVRSTGYFTPTFFMFLVSVYALFFCSASAVGAVDSNMVRG